MFLLHPSSNMFMFTYMDIPCDLDLEMPEFYCQDSIRTENMYTRVVMHLQYNITNTK